VEFYHGSLTAKNECHSDKILFKLNPYTHTGQVRLFQLGYYRMPQLLHASNTTFFSPSFWVSTWYFQKTWSSPGEACLPKYKATPFYNLQLLEKYQYLH
jgi:hypothetical protein